MTCPVLLWLKLLRLAADDDLVSSSWFWDAEREKWVTSRSRELPSDTIVDLPSGQLVDSGGAKGQVAA